MQDDYTMWLQIPQHFISEEVESMLTFLDSGQLVGQQIMTEVMLFDFQEWVIKGHIGHVGCLLLDT